MFEKTIHSQSVRLLSTLAGLLLAIFCELAVAGPIPGWYSARLDFSSALIDFEGAGASFSTTSPGVSLIRQGNSVTGVQWALGQVSVGYQPELEWANPANIGESFSMTVGSETLTFQIGSVYAHYGWYYQMGLPLFVTGSPAPFRSAANDQVVLVTTDYGTVQPFTFRGPYGNDPLQGLFVAKSLRMEFIPSFSDPAFSLLQAIGDGNGTPPPNIPHSQLYAMDMGTLTIGALPDVSSVPEPASIGLALLGLAALSLAQREPKSG